MTACKITRNIRSTESKLHACNYTHFRVFACKVRGHCVDTACNVRVIHALYARVMLQSL